MNKYLFAFLIFFYVTNNVAAQHDPTFTRHQLATLADDIGVKAEQLCEYIVEIGSSTSGISDEEKDEIIKYRLSPLFWNYAERFMKTTGGAYGTTIRTKPMSQYFINLKAQASYNLNRQVKYELAYDEVYSISTLYDIDSWEKLDQLEDGCEVWRNSIKLRQKYYVIDYTRNDQDLPSLGKITHFEGDDKYLYVYIIKTPKNENIARIGDVYMTIRTDTFNIK